MGHFTERNRKWSDERLGWQTTNLFALISGHSACSRINFAHTQQRRQQQLQHIKVSFNVLCRLVCFENENSAKVEKLVNTNKEIDGTWLQQPLVVLLQPPTNSNRWSNSELIGTTVIWLPFISVKMSKLRCANGDRQEKGEKKLFIYWTRCRCSFVKSQCFDFDKQINSLYASRSLRWHIFESFLHIGAAFLCAVGLPISHTIRAAYSIFRFPIGSINLLQLSTNFRCNMVIDD